LVSKHLFEIDEVAELIGATHELLNDLIDHHWLELSDPEARRFDTEDVARARLICSLRSEMGVNDESVPIILHLIDQLHRLQWEIKKWSAPFDAPDC
jgi:chaperone modulatory protein CbpM